MIQIIVQAQKASCRKSSEERITTGMVGKSVSFDFDASWSGLVKTAVFEGSGAAKDVTLTGDTAEIPHECLTVPGGMLSVGVFGTDGTMQTPTIYTDIGQIERGADPSGDESADPTLPIWSQLQAMMGDLGNLTTTAGTIWSRPSTRPPRAAVEARRLTSKCRSQTGISSTAQTEGQTGAI